MKLLMYTLNISIIKNNYKKLFVNNYYLLLILIVTITKVTYSYYIPINILPNAVHDDALFFRLAENITKFEWLGPYENTTLIKGFTYPLFISLSILLDIPIRCLEAILVCASSFYFLTIFKKKIPNYLQLILYSILIFYPYLYSASDFRLLRDMIYSQLLLVLFSSILHIFISQKEDLIKNNKKHILLFSISLFLFYNTREEFIWIIPAFLFVFLILVVSYFKSNNFKIILKVILLSLSIFLLLQTCISTLNYFKYKSSIINIWKDKDFQAGYGSLQRLSQNNLLYDHITFQNWMTFSRFSPSVEEIIPLILQPVYKSWIPTSCYAIKTQGFDVDKHSSCPNEIAVGFVLFALNDVLWQAGYRTPDDISKFMRRVSNEIDYACESKKIICNPKPPSVMPAQIFNFELDISSIVENLIKSFKLTITYGGVSWEKLKAHRELDKLHYMREKLNAFLLDPIDIQQNYTNNLIEYEPTVKNLKEGNFGYIDSLTFDGGIIHAQGWAIFSKDKKFSSVDIYINGEKKCSEALLNNRPDIYPLYPENIGFYCKFPFKFDKDFSYEIKAYAKLDNDIHHYLLKNTSDVNSIFENKFNPYLEMLNAHQFIKNGLLLYSFNLFLLLYKYFIYVSSAMIIPIVFFMIRKKDYLYLTILGIFLILSLSRTVIVSILSYYALLPLSPLYLISGIYSYFICCTVAFITGLHYFILYTNIWRNTTKK